MSMTWDAPRNSLVFKPEQEPDYAGCAEPGRTDLEVSCGVEKVPEPTGALTLTQHDGESCQVSGGSDERSWPRHIAAPPAGIELPGYPERDYSALLAILCLGMCAVIWATPKLISFLRRFV